MMDERTDRWMDRGIHNGVGIIMPSATVTLIFSY